MGKYILKRLIQTIPMIFIVSIISFIIMHSTPGDPVRAYITPKMTHAQVEQIRENLGLNKPLPVQYIHWLSNTIKGDLGYSLVNFRPVKIQIEERIPPTLLLMGLSLVFSITIGVLFGVVSAYYKKRMEDKVLTLFSYLNISIPSFWLAMILIVIFSVKLRLLPSVGMHSIGEDSVLDVLEHCIMPVTVLSCYNIGVISRYIKSSTLIQSKEDYVKTAKAKGLSKRNIFIKHILRNSILPIITMLGLSLPGLVTGAFITETIFGWPGMGRLGVQAIYSFDYPIIMAITMISSILLIIGNLISDILYGLVDPRIKVVK